MITKTAQSPARWKRNERAMAGFGLIGLAIMSLAMWPVIVALVRLALYAFHYLTHLPVLTD